MDKKTIVVVGAGKGCGNHVARKFGKEDFRVILMSRNLEHLKQYEEEFKAQNIEAYTQTVDASDLNSITQAFNNVKAKWGMPDVVFYNVGVTTADADLTEPKDANLLLRRYQVDVAGAYHAIQQEVGGQAVLGRQHLATTPWPTERHGYDPTYYSRCGFDGTQRC